MAHTENTFGSFEKNQKNKKKKNCFSVLRRGSKEVTYLRLVDFCITHL